MEYIKADFDNLLLNVYKHKLGTDLYSKFPILTKYPEFSPDAVKKRTLSVEKVIRYVVYAFDPNSPVTAINDILERRIEAASLAGFTARPNGKFGTCIEKMIKSLNPGINHMVIRYAMLIGNTDYSVLITYEDSLLKELIRLADFGIKVDEDSNEKKSVLIANISTLRKSINELKESFFANNTDTFLLRSLSEFSEAKKIELSPEFYAEKLKGWNNVSRYWESLNGKVKDDGKSGD